MKSAGEMGAFSYFVTLEARTPIIQGHFSPGPHASFHGYHKKVQGCLANLFAKLDV